VSFRSSRGFTLVELLVIIAILGVISSIVVVSTRGGSQPNLGRACQADLQAVTTASEAFYTQNSGRFASSIQEMISAGTLAYAPSPTGYSINYDSTTGAVTASHGTPPVTGCPASP
jgi:prepilin-type N-terminal cleavage/methylation domain-containing protein